MLQELTMLRLNGVLTVSPQTQSLLQFLEAAVIAAANDKSPARPAKYYEST